MTSITDNRGTSRLMGYLYVAIAAITLLAGGVLQASLWACGAAIWFVTTGQEEKPLTPAQKFLAKLFTAAFVVMLLVYALMLFRHSL